MIQIFGVLFLLLEQKENCPKIADLQLFNVWVKKKMKFFEKF